MKRVFSAVAATALMLGGVAGAAFAQDAGAEKAMPALMEELAKYQAGEKTIAKNLATFDTLDFDVYTNQKWDRLHESHAKDILVHYPDGHTTKGIDAHIEELKPTFVFAPDTRIEQHPVRFGSGEWTGVIGVMEGTFTRPMPIGGGKTIEPTGKAFKIQMATLGHWTKEGVMDEEYLFWDNQGFMKQIGLAQ
ncbi:ester cyclase [Ensifer sp. LC163]|uniref:ester cyclase n=1 Tax=Ensifer sp. LC163 TaxID=1120652 RepID=UPI0008137425|nr:ester cyclase [Ensifer sp. LC163]OCP38048.1 polyketide cyclase [Ensifer sp. LC163]